MRIDVLSPRELSPADVSAWTRLQGAAPGLASPFLSPGWSLALDKAGGPDRDGGRVAVLRDSGDAVGVFAARVSRLTAMPAGAPMCDYQGLIAAPSLRLDPRELVKALGIQRLDFSNLLADQAPFEPYLRSRCASHVIDLADGFEDYAKARRDAGSDILQDTAKKRRKLERDHGPVSFAAQSASRADLEQLLAWKRAQYRATGQTDIFEAGWTERLVHHLHTAAEPGCAGALFSLHVGEQLIAAHFALKGQGVLHAWFIAHDDAFGRYSPGVILIADILRWAGAEGINELDLGPGDYQFKQRLANAQRALGHGFVARSPTAGLVRDAQYRVRSAAEALPLGRYSALPGKAMRRLDQWRGLR